MSDRATAGEIITVSSTVGAGVGAHIALEAVGGRAGLTAATAIPVVGATFGGLAATYLAADYVGETINRSELFQEFKDWFIDQTLYLRNAIPEGIPPSQFKDFSRPADGSTPWVIQPIEDLGRELRNTDVFDRSHDMTDGRTADIGSFDMGDPFGDGIILIGRDVVDPLLGYA